MEEASRLPLPLNCLADYNYPSISLIWFISLVYSIYDSTEAVIQEMVEEYQRKISEQHNSLIINEYLKLKIRTLQKNAPRDPDKFEQLLKEKRRKVRNFLFYFIRSSRNLLF